MQVFHCIRYGAALNVHHKVNARAAGGAAMVFPAVAMLGMPLENRKRGVLVGMMRRVIQRLVAALALLQAEPVRELV
ncbi:hypothetical protein [Paraburkholderia graminis]|uniref:hypothetical protein n=1 Tax=Paraburkholderia graminis TaxID=60548 RepID=UPI0038B7CE27